MSMQSVGRPTRPEAAATQGHASLTGGRGLLQDEPLIFELGGWDKTGVDLPEPEADASDLAGLTRKDLPLPGLSEPEAVRHYVRLSQKNHAIDLALYPLGSCTMKHNPRLNERMARLPGFSDVHPLQPVSTVQGALALMDGLAHWLKALTGMPAVALPPKAGAHGELCGLLAIHAAHDAKGDTARRRVLVPTSAHGTNPATAAFVGYSVTEIAQTEDGRVDLVDLAAKLGPDVAAIMVTNPNTCGLFERDVIEIARLAHEAGAYFYCDGANFNAIVGKVRPGDLGVDAMHINLHKTFSTPHGGGGPGAGPVVLSEALAPFAPAPWVVSDENGFRLVEEAAGEAAQAFGRMSAFHGQMGMFVRAYAYMLSHGADGLRQVAEDAVLNANYVKARLQDLITPAFPDGPCMHEALFDDTWLEGTGITTLDVAKAMIDEGFHPMTMYFPLVVHGAMLVEPTETESKAELDRFCDAMRALAQAAKAGDVERFKGAPYLAPMRRLDETLAARKPKLAWRPDPNGVAPAPLAAE
ncbi:MAG: aminomethyl-transferring glycine dehydrogenase subunit GcvPB [Phenylobacterium sp.]|jgi:glycine dehydrogenase subunit 2|uniref:aminomethyl-transferring glycine dehydrogenase subunit GcvPB n=1 Tax=Phenylobacterium sp. TaxID=1871053 RepID=UPI002A36B4C1|nr:aminomethyl-transferring glycine dehydrogenase subunit GcvPB [Phenylobacterium sp.]MDX9997736.1 aminomethyl-transferring glycine dehydrogenase subunit GcvPB [Phenylobacterium sp.]